MNLTRRGALLSAAGFVLAPAVALARPRLPGDEPLYDARDLSAVPNAAAIGRRYWMPGLNDGFVPQGLTVFGNEILVAAYQSETLEQDNGPARVYRLARSDGRLLGSFALPATYGHPGGLAAVGDNVFVANSGRLLALDFARSCAAGECVPLGERLVDKAMGPSFLAATADTLWFGPYRRKGEPNLYGVPLARVLSGGERPIGLSDAAATLPLPLFVQGATFDRKGASGSRKAPGTSRPPFPPRPQDRGRAGALSGSGRHRGSGLRAERQALGRERGRLEALEPLGHVLPARLRDRSRQARRLIRPVPIPAAGATTARARRFPRPSSAGPGAGRSSADAAASPASARPPSRPAPARAW